MKRIAKYYDDRNEVIINTSVEKTEVMLFGTAKRTDKSSSVERRAGQIITRSLHQSKSHENGYCNTSTKMFG